MPVAQHPLFPAAAALWSAALLGSASLAIRLSLIDSFVMSTRIDLIVPAATPPLGVTARILLALGFAAFGATLGAWMGRKLGQHQPNRHERNRNALGGAPEKPRVRQRDAHPDAPARRPISAHDELDLAAADEPAEETGPLLATRLRTHSGEAQAGSPDMSCEPQPPSHNVLPPSIEFSPPRTGEALATGEEPLPDLAERLTEALRRRRDAREASAWDAAAVAAAAAIAPTPNAPAPIMPEQSDDEDDDADGDELCEAFGTDEARFGSLLSVNRVTSWPAHSNVAAPVPSGGAAEPLVIFPDQAARRVAFTKRASFGARLAGGAATQPDRLETENALRAALASLQRISGTA